MAERESEFVPVKWRMGATNPHEYHKIVHIEERIQRDGSALFAITRMGDVLAKDGEWEYEPQPSSRDDAFMARTRYASFLEAAQHATRSLRASPSGEHQNG